MSHFETKVRFILKHQLVSFRNSSQSWFKLFIHRVLKQKFVFEGVGYSSQFEIFNRLRLKLIVKSKCLIMRHQHVSI